MKHSEKRPTLREEHRREFESSRVREREREAIHQVDANSNHVNPHKERRREREIKIHMLSDEERTKHQTQRMHENTNLLSVFGSRFPLGYFNAGTALGFGDGSFACSSVETAGVASVGVDMMDCDTQESERKRERERARNEHTQ
jgi:hypothetical protein